MSGPEALHVLSLIDPTISFLNFAKRVQSNAKDTENLPSAFQDVANHLDVVSDALNTARSQIEQRDDDSTCANMKDIVENCNDKAARLQKMFLKVVPSPAARRMECYREAVREIGKGNRVEVLMQSLMMEGVQQLLTVDDGMTRAAESQLRALAEALDKVSAIPPSLEDENPTHGIFNYGNGPQNVNTGVGTQNNNNAGGRQYIGGTFHGGDH